MGKEQAGISKMAGLGTIVNVAGILAGCGVGAFIKRRTAQTAAGYDFQRSGAVRGVCWHYGRPQRADDHKWRQL